MMQLIIPGFEDYVDFDKAIFNPEGLINHLNRKGYSWLTDFNSGNLLVGKTEGEPYVPYRVQFLSGKILDEEEIFQDFSDLEKIGFPKKEIQDARLLYYAINHENTPKDEYKFNNWSFASKEDETNTIKKYIKTPFQLDVA